MNREGIVEKRKDFFKKIMDILEKAEGVRDTNYGPFSFLWENSYVRDAVVSSFDTTTSITGLKMFLAMNVLEMHTKENSSKISYEQLRALLQEAGSKKYNINYRVLDECIDVNKNKEIICEKMNDMYTVKVAKESVEYIKNTDELFPYLFMDRLRNAAWSKLRDFFKLCEQTVCSECSKKNKVYFQFIQAVALYEIFYICLVQDPTVDDMEKMEKMIEIIREVEKERHKAKDLVQGLSESRDNLSIEKVEKLEKVAQRIEHILNEKEMREFEYHARHIEINHLLENEFGISLSAMLYLLMIFEAMQVCNYEMRGLKHLSLKMRERMNDIYDKDLAMLEKMNHKRLTRYRKVNQRIEELLENSYAKREMSEETRYSEEDAIYMFMEELCKPMKKQNKKFLRGLELILAYPIQHEKKETEISK